MDNKLVININEKNINRIIRNTRKISEYCDLNNKKLHFKGYMTEEIKNIEKAINIKDMKKRYSFIYDVVCDYIDKKYLKCNYCDFKDDVCIYFRVHNNFNHKNGCCYSDARGGLCKHLKDHNCDIKSISCKLYSCEYLRKNKVNFRMKDIPLIKYFFNIKQKYYIKYSFFEDKSYVMLKLIENM